MATKPLPTFQINEVSKKEAIDLSRSMWFYFWVVVHICVICLCCCCIGACIAGNKFNDRVDDNKYKTML